MGQRAQSKVLRKESREITEQERGRPSRGALPTLPHKPTPLLLLQYLILGSTREVRGNRLAKSCIIV